MSIKHGPGLAEDAIRFRLDYEGSEPRDIRERVHSFPKGCRRCAVVINTLYQHLPGGYYFNRSLLELIGGSLRSLGFFIVWPEVYCEDSGISIPAERAISLEMNEEYLLVDDDHVVRGGAMIWQYSVGGGGSFYSDDIVVDLLLEDSCIHRFSNDLEQRCKASCVALFPSPS